MLFRSSFGFLKVQVRDVAPEYFNTMLVTRDLQQSESGLAWSSKFLQINVFQYKVCS